MFSPPLPLQLLRPPFYRPPPRWRGFFFDPFFLRQANRGVLGFFFAHFPLTGKVALLPPFPLQTRPHPLRFPPLAGGFSSPPFQGLEGTFPSNSEKRFDPNFFLFSLATVFFILTNFGGMPGFFLVLKGQKRFVFPVQIPPSKPTPPPFSPAGKFFGGFDWGFPPVFLRFSVFQLFFRGGVWAPFYFVCGHNPDHLPLFLIHLSFNTPHQGAVHNF